MGIAKLEDGQGLCVCVCVCVNYFGRTKAEVTRSFYV